MINLTTNYLGLQLKNPVIVGSCSYTTSLEDIKELAKYGAGAIVLGSVFEEEILCDLNRNNLKSFKENPWTITTSI